MAGRVPLGIWRRALELAQAPDAVTRLRRECGVGYERAALLLIAVRCEDLFGRPVARIMTGENLLPRVGWYFRPYRRTGGTDYATAELLRCAGLKKQPCQMHPQQEHIHVLSEAGEFCYRAWGFEVTGQIDRRS